MPARTGAGPHPSTPRSGRATSHRSPVGRALATVGVFLLLLAAVGNRAFAAQDDERAERPEGAKTITIGESNSEAERAELLQYFEADEDRDEIITISLDETVRATEGIDFGFGQFTTAYSSTALACRELGEGLDVATRNINGVTPGLYAMALVTAGIGDAALVVAAPAANPSRGVAALTGVFKNWELDPCESSQTTPERQRLALEEMALTVRIGTAFVAAGIPNGLQLATDLVLESQRIIVIKEIKDQKKIDGTVAAREEERGVAIPGDLRPQLVDLLTRLAGQEIDWSTFAAGWSIETNADNTRITMTGDGIAVRAARATATAEAVAAQTATAQAKNSRRATESARVAQTAAAEARGTEAVLRATEDAQATVDAQATLNARAESAALATANAQGTARVHAQATADARATQDAQAASAAQTATAAAVPTATPVPPVGVAGKVIAVADGQLTVLPDGAAAETAYTVDAAAEITRGGQPAELAKVAEGDTVQLTVDGVSQVVLGLSATPAPGESPLAGLGMLLYVLPLGLVVPLGLMAKRRITTEPFIVRRLD